MRLIIGLLFVLAFSLPASAAQKNCDKLKGEKRSTCLSDNIKDLNATVELLTKGFLLANSGNTNNNPCIGLQTDTTTSPIMLPCAAGSKIQIWTIKKAQ